MDKLTKKIQWNHEDSYENLYEHLYEYSYEQLNEGFEDLDEHYHE